MKTDRLYAITVYLLNHGKTPASQLSERLEVSVRTVQRDIECLCRAGIPIVAQTGAAGGYYLADRFQLDGQLATREDYALIRTALKGFSSALDDPRLHATLEKFLSLGQGGHEGIVLDLSVLREGDRALLRALQAAIGARSAVRFTYTNAEGVIAARTVEPVALVYRWYAWYLLAYSPAKGGYRTYKLARMQGLERLNAPFTKEHPPAEELLRRQENSAPPATTAVTLRCSAGARAQASEYLRGQVTREYEGGACEMLAQVVEKEQFWFGALLALGGEVEVLAPEHIRQRVLAAAQNVAALYQKP